MGFNPRPLLLTGESLLSATVESRWKLFQSTPVIANGRITASAGGAGARMPFQSTPVIANALKAASHAHHPHRFNPRPLLLTGESP